MRLEKFHKVVANAPQEIKDKIHRGMEIKDLVICIRNTNPYENLEGKLGEDIYKLIKLLEEHFDI